MDLSEEIAGINSRNKHILNEDLLALIPPAGIGNGRSGNNDFGDSSSRRITRSLHTRFFDVSSYYLNCVNKEKTCSDTDRTDLLTTYSDIQTDITVNFKNPQEDLEGGHTHLVSTL